MLLHIFSDLFNFFTNFLQPPAWAKSSLATGDRGSGFKTEGLWVLKVQQTEARSTGLRVSSRNVYIIYTNLSFSEKPPLWKMLHIIFLHIIEYRPNNNYYYFRKTPRVTNPFQNLGVAIDPQPPRIDAYMYVMLRLQHRSINVNWFSSRPYLFKMLWCHVICYICNNLLVNV